MTISTSLADLVVRTAASIAKERPAHPALVDGDATLTYSELLVAASALARELEDAGVGAESVVALDLEPGARTVVAMLAAGRCGAAFLPIDPREPAARRAAMYDVARPAAVVTADAVLPTVDGARLDERLPARVGPAAYVSFTSGSTGVPKAVVTEQPAIVNYIEQVVAAYGLGPDDRQLQFSSIAFDIAIDEIFSTLAAGATLVHRGADFVFGGVEEFLERCRERDITVLDLPTGLWNRLGAELATRPGVRLPMPLRLVVVGGEAAAARAVAAWHAAATHPDFQILNAYGPTEAAVSVTLGALRSGQAVTIGRPLDGIAVDLLDASDRSVAVGEVGEIVVSGVAVARGYLDRPGVGFVDLDGVWSYRTGDLATRDVAGDLEFLGRADAQVKVRGGFRVEPGEIAAVLHAQPGVRQVHVQAHERPGGKVLAAFVVPTGSTIDAAALQRAIADALPDWMVPWHVRAVDAIPLTERGKVDEAILAALLPHDAVEGASADVQTVVAAAWETALGAGPENGTESFFEAGGDSLAALELIEILTQRLGWAPAMSDFYRAPTVEDLVMALTAHELEQDVPTAHHTTGRTLVRMRRSGSGRLWCFLPPLSGAVTRYAAMASLLPAGDAVWAMETPAELSDGGMDRVAEGLTERLLSENLAAFDSVVFSGYSLGGVFAHEIALRVEAALAQPAGRRPAVAALLLDPPDPADPQLTLNDAFDIFVRVGWRITAPVESFLTADGYDLAGVAEAARRAGSLPPAAADDEVTEAWTVYASNARILDDYVPRTAVARTHLLLCQEDADIAEGTWSPGEHAGSWAGVLPVGQTSVIAVEHFALMEPPNDRTVLRWLVETAKAH
jgi:amino acid adenylation domain-containing protein